MRRPKTRDVGVFCTINQGEQSVQASTRGRTRPSGALVSRAKTEGAQPRFRQDPSRSSRLHGGATVPLAPREDGLAPSQDARRRTYSPHKPRGSTVAGVPPPRGRTRPWCYDGFRGEAGTDVAASPRRPTPLQRRWAGGPDLPHVLRMVLLKASNSPSLPQMTAPEARMSSPSRRGWTMPPASRTRIRPAAMSQGFSSRSQNPS